MHNDTKMIKQRLYSTHLPRIKPVGEHGIRTKHPLPPQCKRHGCTVLPPITRSTSSRSSLTGDPLISPLTTVETLPPINTYNSTLHEAAQRSILRSDMAQLSQEPSSIHITHSAHPKRTTLYDHIPAKVDTGLPRTNSIHPIEDDTHQLEPIRSVDWLALKHEIGHDIHIRAHTKRILFNSGITYTTQITTLGNLVRSKVKGHLSSTTGSGDERYKIVVHLTVFPTTAEGLHVASRCLWNSHTDNSITIKMQGVDCDILIIVFLCYTDL